MSKHLQEKLKVIKESSYSLLKVTDGVIQQVLEALAKRIEKEETLILYENRKDLDNMDPGDPKYDRLSLTPLRLSGLATDLRAIANLPSPIDVVLDKKLLPNGLKLSKVSVPLGVIGAIFESRPNVVIDIFALAIKASNAVILKGGKEAKHSNEVLVKLIQDTLADFDLDPSICHLVTSNREELGELLLARQYIDVLIPRGSQQLIEYVRSHSKIPVIETGAGIVHTYVDEFADDKKALDIIYNAKMRRVSVCNALDTLIMHQAKLELLNVLQDKLKKDKVEIYADSKSYQVLKKFYPAHLLFLATEADYGREFLSPKLSIKTVEHFDEALDHIYRYSSGHSEAIISENHHRIADFHRLVDAAVVYSNASTAFTDGGQFGLGAEVGISTQKLHARGPMGVEALTSYKWIVEGNGQIRMP